MDFELRLVLAWSLVSCKTLRENILTFPSSSFLNYNVEETTVSNMWPLVSAQF